MSGQSKTKDQNGNELGKEKDKLWKINETSAKYIGHVGRAMFGPTLKKYLHSAQAITQTEWLKSS